SDTVYAGVVVLRASDWQVVERQGVVSRCRFPYVPGLLSFREAPPLLEAFARTEAEPDLVMFDGQGLAHPRRVGVAGPAGLWLGVAKSRYLGLHRNVREEAGSAVDLLDEGGAVIGRVVRTRSGVRPVYVSVGHKIDLDSAVRWVLAAAVAARVPEPTR